MFDNVLDVRVLVEDFEVELLVRRIGLRKIYLHLQSLKYQRDSLVTVRLRSVVVVITVVFPADEMLNVQNNESVIPIESLKHVDVARNNTCCNG